MLHEPSRRKQRFRFYRGADGSQTVRAELLKLPVDAQAALAELMDRKERDECFGDEDKAIQDYPLRELRLALSGNAYRVLYAPTAPHHEILLAVAVVEKKASKLPRSTLKTAARRLRDWEARGGDRSDLRKRTGAPSRREQKRKKPRSDMV